MRSSRPTRRLRSCPPAAPSLDPAAPAADELLSLAHVIHGSVGAEPVHHEVYLAPVGGDEVEIGLRPLPEGMHPFPVVAGFTAPPEWSVYGLSVTGTVHHLEGERPSRRTLTTYLLARDGTEASLVDVGGEVMEPGGPAEGTIADLCRRVLDLPTAPPPTGTSLLWTVAWLDRVLEAWGDPARRRDLMSSWSAVAVLHPAAEAAQLAPAALTDPRALLSVAHVHASEWSWARLRAEPAALVLPDAPLPEDVTTWMDDGFYARWAFGAYPHPTVLVRDVVDLLGPEVAPTMVGVLTEVLEAA